TSNIGSHHIAAIEDRAGLSPEDKKELVRRAVMEDVRKAFRPEFINRLDEIVVFHRLERDQIRQIIEIQMRQFAQRLARRELTLELKPAAKDLLSRTGWDPPYCPRPPQRPLPKVVPDPLPQPVLAGGYPPRHNP